MGYLQEADHGFFRTKINIGTICDANFQRDSPSSMNFLVKIMMPIDPNITQYSQRFTWTGKPSQTIRIILHGLYGSLWSLCYHMVGFWWPFLVLPRFFWSESIGLHCLNISLATQTGECSLRSSRVSVCLATRLSPGGGSPWLHQVSQVFWGHRKNKPSLV